MKEVITKYLASVRKTKRLPTYSDLHSQGIKKSQIKTHFVNLENLHHYIEENHLTELSKYITHENEIFSKRKLKDIKDEVKGYKRFFITTAVTEKAVDVNFYNAIKNYCDRENAKLILLPCSDMFSRRKSARWTFDKLIANEIFVHTELSLNKNIFLSSIKITAKQIKPTTGLNRISQRNGSYVFASPKQFLEYVAVGSEPPYLPRAIMTPGCLTVPDYHTDRYMSERLSYIAENDHVMGGIVVEIQDTKNFHFRQVQASKDGSFIDFAKRYNSDGTIEDVDADIILGDWHSGQTDPIVKKCTADLCRRLNIRDIIVHDFFDGGSINPHERKLPLKQAKKALRDALSLEDELIQGAKDFEWLGSLCRGNIIRVFGNHEDFLNRYLDSTGFISDPQNYYICLDLSMKYLDGEDVLEYAYNKYGKLKNPEKITWLSRKDSFKIGGVECGKHGDRGIKGTRGTLMSNEKALGPSVVGHTHTAAILRMVFRVGTSTIYPMEYQESDPLNDTQTHCLIYGNGSRQLINIIRGNYSI